MNVYPFNAIDLDMIPGWFAKKQQQSPIVQIVHHVFFIQGFIPFGSKNCLFLRCRDAICSSRLGRRNVYCFGFEKWMFRPCLVAVNGLSLSLLDLLVVLQHHVDGIIHVVQSILGTPATHLFCWIVLTLPMQCCRFRLGRWRFSQASEWYDAMRWLLIGSQPSLVLVCSAVFLYDCSSSSPCGLVFLLCPFTLRPDG